MVQATLLDEYCLTESTDRARDLYAKHHFGTVLSGQIKLNLYEALFLVEKGKLTVLKGSTTLDFAALMRFTLRRQQDAAVAYAVFSDLRKKGYIVKSATKFGSVFRVYDKGVAPGKDHARWLVYAVSDRQRIVWQDFAGKNRIAHTAKKQVLIGVVDEDVTYYETSWIRP